jgi:hypothetical protein
MIKLYKNVKGTLRYHEAWEEAGAITEHWGVVGERGDSRQHEMPKRTSVEKALQEVLKGAIEDGYAEMEFDEMKIVNIEYAIDGMGSPSDHDKRRALEERMNETLGWVGVGHCDGGSIGSGTMEACCMVVDAEIAMDVIEGDLKDTQFADYSRIYEEEL